MEDMIRGRGGGLEVVCLGKHAERHRHDIPDTCVHSILLHKRPPSALCPAFPCRLLFRTLNQDLGLPNHNNDYLAVKMRDELMPIRCGRGQMSRVPLAN